MLCFNEKITSVTAYAPATCSNLAVGYDLLGFPINSIGDTITLTRHTHDALIIQQIESQDTLPTDPEKNVATAVIKKFCDDHNLPRNFSLSIRKGIALGSGMGGSAASSVAALTALNGFLQKPVDLATLADYAIFGEALACGNRHADNAVPCLYGGMTLTRSLDPLDVIRLPDFNGFCILIHPKLRLDTRESRAALPSNLPLATYVQQSANLAAFIVGLYEQNNALIKRSLQDVLIEPWRAALVKGFTETKHAALAGGALGCSLSGSGPSVFALAASKIAAEKAKAAMMHAFLEKGIESHGWVSNIRNKGAEVTAISQDKKDY